MEQSENNAAQARTFNDQPRPENQPYRSYLTRDSGELPTGLRSAVNYRTPVATLDQTVETVQYLTQVKKSISGYVNQALLCDHTELALSTINHALSQMSTSINILIQALKSRDRIEDVLNSSEASGEQTVIDSKRLLAKMSDIITDEFISLDLKMHIATILIRIDEFSIHAGSRSDWHRGIAKSERGDDITQVEIVSNELLSHGLEVSAICAQQRLCQPINKSPNWWNRMVAKVKSW